MLESTYTAAIQQMTDNAEEVMTAIREGAMLAMEPENQEKLEQIERDIVATQEEVLEGLRHLKETLDGCVEVAFGCVWDELWPLSSEKLPLVPLHLYLTYPWEQS